MKLKNVGVAGRVLAWARATMAMEEMVENIILQERCILKCFGVVEVGIGGRDDLGNECVEVVGVGGQCR